MLTRTTTALLNDLADPANEDAWALFDDRFRPVLIGFAYRLGLNATDAADAAQETLMRVVQSYRAGKYDRERGRLHSWIVGIARNCISDQKSKRSGRREHRGMSAIADLPDDGEMRSLWNDECRAEILRRAISTLRTETRTDERTIRIFELLAFHQLAAQRVAEEIGVTTNDVYVAKHRCLRKLRTIVAELDRAFEIEEQEDPS